MPPPTYSVGQVVGASDVNEWFVPKAAYKAADQSVTSSIVLVNDNALFFAGTANASYDVELQVLGSWSATLGLQFDFGLPAGATMKYTVSFNGAMGPEVAGTPDFTVSTVGVIWFRGVAVLSSTPGNVQFKFAQHSSGATPTTVSATSFIVGRRIN